MTKRLAVALAAVLSISAAHAVVDQNIAQDEFSLLVLAATTALAVGPNGEVYNGGDFAILAPPYNTQPYFRRTTNVFAEDPTFTPAPDGFVLAVAVQADGKVVAGGRFANIGGIARSGLARVNFDGSGDASFANAAPDADVRVLVVDHNGGILVGGDFTTISGQAHAGLARLNPDGTLDPDFPAVSGGAARVRAIAIQRDGRILIGGDFTQVGGVPRANLARLLPSGAVDPTLTAATDGMVEGLLEQHDRRILVGGSFATLAGAARAFVGRIDANGAIDPAFDPGTNGPVHGFIEQADRRIVVIGDFDVLGSARAEEMGRVFRDGSRDPPEGTLDVRSTFNIANSPGSQMFGVVQTLDGRIVVAGAFSGPESFKNVTGFYPNGYQLWASRPYDTGGNPAAGNYEALAQLPNGDVIFGGDFTTLAGNVAALARMSSDLWTSVDQHLLPYPTAGGRVRALAADRQGRALVCGDFPTVGGQSHAGLARVLADQSVDATFNPPAGPGACTGLDIDESGRVLAMYEGASGGVRRYLDSGAPDPTFNVAGTPVLANFREVAALPGGKLLVAGGSVTVVQSKLLRLNADGTPDGTFAAPAFAAATNQALIDSIAVRADGRILVAGRFISVDGVNRAGLARFDANGALDASFDPPPGMVYSGVSLARGGILPLIDGRAYVAGRFFGPTVTTIAVIDPVVRRLLDNGADDPAFPAPWQGPPVVLALDMQPTGALLIGGRGAGYRWFDESGTQTAISLNDNARLTPREFPVRRLVVTPSLARWELDGLQPEFRTVWFELSTDGGATWSPLGDATRIAAGWELQGLALPLQQSIFVRARSEYRTGTGVSQWTEQRPFWLSGDPMFRDGFESG